ncbi:MAG: hypothetical protein ACYDBB_26180 [Armatimonadota bacterium]
MRWWMLVLALVVPGAGLADGMAWGKGFTPALRETHQLAVIGLTESTADVSMFIAIEGIPAGQELTYVLPFWSAPVGFAMAEDEASNFRGRYVEPAHQEVERMQRLAAHRASRNVLQSAAPVGMGVAGLLISAVAGPRLMSAREKGRMPGTLSAPGGLLPYAVHTTPHARAELYRIGTQDLQQLLRQSGLPGKYLQPLAKYKTPYLAVMRLKGLAPAGDQHEAHPATAKIRDRSLSYTWGPDGRPTSGKRGFHAPPKPIKTRQTGMSSRGVRYHFTHQLAGMQYTYPLGTGAAWPQPIPTTEVYLTCPPRLAMQVSAPVEGEKMDWLRFSREASQLNYYRTVLPDKLRDTPETKQEMAALLTARTASMIEKQPQRPFAWHIAYLESNPAEDIRVQLTPRAAPWRFALADAFTVSWVATTACILLYLLAWGFTFRLVIRRRWLRAGSPDTLLGHGLETFYKAQVIVPVVIWSVGIVVYRISNLSEYYYDPPSVWAAIPLLLFGVGCTLAAIIVYARRPGDWRKWLTVTSCLVSTLLYAALAGGLYGLVWWCERV